MNSPTKVFVVEGEDRDIRLLNSLIRVFFRGKYESKIIALPAQKNIYMLYTILKENGFDSDFLETLRENVDGASEKLDGVTRQDVDEIFLFFDLDFQQNNLPSSMRHNTIEILKELVDYFDNETENGKLYVSYPMIEATYDFRQGECTPFTTCYLPMGKGGGKYKELSGKDNPVASWHFDYVQWAEAIKVHALRVQCLFNCPNLGYTYYRKNIKTVDILEKQIDLLRKHECIFVLSAFPEFLLDYFKKAFWVKHFKLINDKINHCVLRKE